MVTQLLTKEQVKQAAYKLCEALGVDPEQPTPADPPTSQVGGSPVLHTIFVTQPLWRSVAARIVDADRIQHAIQFAREITDGNAIG